MLESNKIVNRIYGGFDVDQIFSSHLTDKKQQECIFNFGNIDLIDNLNNGRKNDNIKIMVQLINIKKGMDIYTTGNAWIIFPIITFCKMIKNYNLDVRELEKNNCRCKVIFIKENIKSYRIKELKILKE